MPNFYKSIFSLIILGLFSIANADSYLENKPIEKLKFEKLNIKSVTELRKITKKNENNATKEKLLSYFNFFNGKAFDNNAGERLIKWDKRKDIKKLVNFDRFDCMSYIETLLALSSIKNVSDNNREFINQVSDNLVKIMFAANDVSYIGRNHFMDTEWLKNNEKFIARNLTDDLDYAQEKTATIDKSAFLDNQLKSYANKYIKEEKRKKFIKIFSKDTKKFSKLDSKVKYIKFSDFIEHQNDFKKLIDNKIFLFVMIVNKPELIEITKSDHNVVHAGFVYNENEKLVFNHASFSKTVESVDLVEYAKLKEQIPTLVGFSLYELK